MSTTPIWKDIFDAALSGDIASVKYFIEVKGDPVTITNADEKSVAHIAAEFGRLSILKYILNKNASLLEESDIYGNSVLHRAVEKGELKIVKYLVEERGADIFQPNPRLSGNTAIHIAAQKGHFDIVQYFIDEKFVDVNVRNLNGEPPLFSAAEQPYMRIIQFLIEERRANPMMMDSNQDHILFKSARRGDLMLPKYLLDKKKMNFDLNWVNANGDTMIIVASRYNKVGFIFFMLQKNASIFVKDAKNRTPLHYAAAGGHFHLCKLLVEQGASYEEKDAYGHTPLQLTTDQTVKKLFFLNSVKKANMQRYRRSAPAYAVKSAGEHCRRCSSWSQRLLGNEFSLADTISLESTFNSFLVVADAIIKYVRGTTYRARSHSFLLSPWEILRQRMNPLAIDAVNNNLFDLEDHK